MCESGKVRSDACTSCVRNTHFRALIKRASLPNELKKKTTVPCSIFNRNLNTFLSVLSSFSLDELKSYGVLKFKWHLNMLCKIRCIYVQIIAPLTIYRGFPTPCAVLERYLRFFFCRFCRVSLSEEFLGWVRSNNFESSQDRSSFVIRCDYPVHFFFFF